MNMGRYWWWEIFTSKTNTFCHFDATCLCITQKKWTSWKSKSTYFDIVKEVNVSKEVIKQVNKAKRNVIFTIIQRELMEK